MVSGTYLFAGSPYYGVYRSTNGGTSWTWASAGGPWYNKGSIRLASIGANLFAATYGSVFLSADSGISWTQLKTGLSGISSFAVSGTSLFVGTDSGVVMATNNGTVWTAVNSGLTRDVSTLIVHGSNLVAGSEGYVWRRSLSEMIAGVEKGSQLPVQFALYQNYPNPFNPSTTIRYGLPHKSAVQLTVFNTLGQRVAVLQNGEQEAGYHEVRFDASGLSSGVYFYRIIAGDFVQTCKLLLLH